MEIAISYPQFLLETIQRDLCKMLDSSCFQPDKNVWSACTCNIRIAITTDPKDTLQDFVHRYGDGKSYEVILHNYNEGRSYAQAIYKAVKGNCPDMTGYTGAQFSANDQLFLVIYLTDIRPKAATPYTLRAGNQPASIPYRIN